MFSSDLVYRIDARLGPGARRTRNSEFCQPGCHGDEYVYKSAERDAGEGLVTELYGTACEDS